ncbi:MAG: P-loop NTPase [Anaerosomatales bacterium]|nr:P-loop NTPase [Anaerosomatales bacterium]
MPRVLLVDGDARFRSQARATLGSIEGIDVDETATLDDADASVVAAAPDVVVLGPSLDYGSCLAFAERIPGRGCLARVVVVQNAVTLDAVREAMRRGVHDVVPLDGSWAEVAAAVREAASAGRRAEEQAAAVPPRAAVFTVFSTKGGVGKSVIACNLGVSLASIGLSTILVDLDLMFGDAAIMLDLKPERTVYDAVQSFDRLDGELLRAYLTKHSSGLEVLLAPVRPEDAEVVTASRVGTLLDMLARICEVIVIDTAASFDDVVLSAIDRSDEVLAVATLDVASIKNTRVSLQKLAQLGYGGGLASLVLNRADSKVWLDVGEVEKSLPAPIVARIPSDRLVPRSVNRGAPVVLDAPRSAVARALTDLAKHVADRVRTRS